MTVKKIWEEEEEDAEINGGSYEMRVKKCTPLPMDQENQCSPCNRFSSAQTSYAGRTQRKLACLSFL